MNPVRRIQIDEKEVNLADLLQRVERGEEVMIAREGRPFACLKAAPPDPARIEAALDKLWQIGQVIKAKYGPTSPGEIRELIREGRDY